jgi:phosphoenolpyruvate carboxykinase (ATP)
MSLKYTRAIIDAIHDGSLNKADTVTDPVFGLEVPTQCANVPEEILVPKNTWSDKGAFDKTATKLASLFVENFKNYESDASEAVRSAGPKVAAGAGV